MAGKKLNRYRVSYNNASGLKISRVIRATTGDNAYMVVKRTGGKNIKTNKLKR